MSAPQELDAISLVIDTDTASDDAVALLLAARTPHATIRAVTTVAGNVPVHQATRNALVTLEFCGAASVPVHPGAERPLLRPLETAQHVYGTDGMSGVSFPDPTAVACPEHAVDALRRLARDEPGVHTLVTLGPLTNIATALLIEPDVLTRFRRTYLMAGAFDGVGNVHPVGEFNAWADPEALSIVVAAPGTKSFVGWDVSRRDAVLDPFEQTAIAALGPFGDFVVSINRCVQEFATTQSGLAGFDLPDPITMAVALDPRIVMERADASIVVGREDATRGGTFIDHRRPLAAPNGDIVRVVDSVRFKAMLARACAGVDDEQ